LLKQNAIYRSILFSDHASRIQELYTELTAKTVAKSVAAIMFQRGGLTLNELETVQRSRSPDKAAKKLFNILQKQSYEVYECFLEALKQTDQLDVYLLLSYQG
jgi:hypothetical protein